MMPCEINDHICYMFEPNSREALRCLQKCYLRSVPRASPSVDSARKALEHSDCPSKTLVSYNSIDGLPDFFSGVGSQVSGPLIVRQNRLLLADSPLDNHLLEDLFWGLM